MAHAAANHMTCLQCKPSAAKVFVCVPWDLATRPVVSCRSLMVSEIPSSISSCLQRRKPTRRAPVAASILAMTPLWTSTCQTRTSECCCVGCIMQRHPNAMAQAVCWHCVPCCRAVNPDKVSQHCCALPRPAMLKLPVETAAPLEQTHSSRGSWRRAVCMMQPKHECPLVLVWQIEVHDIEIAAGACWICLLHKQVAECFGAQTTSVQSAAVNVAKHPLPSAACWDLSIALARLQLLDRHLLIWASSAALPEASRSTFCAGCCGWLMG